MTGQADTIEIGHNVFEAGDESLVIKFTISVGLETNGIPADDLSLMPPHFKTALLGGLAVGVLASFAVEKNFGLKVLVGSGAGLMGMAVIAKATEPKEQEQI